MVRALASHQCGPVSRPGVDAICGLSLSFLVSLALRGVVHGIYRNALRGQNGMVKNVLKGLFFTRICFVLVSRFSKEVVRWGNFLLITFKV